VFVLTRFSVIGFSVYMKMSGDLQPYVFIYLLSFGLLLHIKKKKRKQKNKKNKTKNKKKKPDSKTKQNGQGSHYSSANYSQLQRPP